MMCTMLVAFATSLSLHAQFGVQRSEPGTCWVNPVEYFKLQSISRTDYQRDYDQGDIDFNKVLKKSGTKVFGLKLKPVCAAGYPEKYAYLTHLGTEDAVYHFDYQDLYGVRGVPLNESSFCIYLDEGISQSYLFDYNASSYRSQTQYRVNESSYNNLGFTGLCIAPVNEGVGFSYEMSGKSIHYNKHSYNNKNARNNTYTFLCSKPLGIDNKYGHFIYFRGANELLVMLSAPAIDSEDIEDFITEETRKAMKHPWARIYFVVEEIMINDEEDPAPILTEEDRTEMVDYLQNLMTWLKGDGDPLGLGEHSSALESAVINTIGIVASILIGNGVASVVGGSGASVVSGLTEAMMEGAAGSTPPPVPNGPDINGLEAKRKEEEEEGTPPDVPQEPEPVDPNKFNPSDYPYGGQYLSQQPDGDIVMKSPVTGKDVHFYSNGDGTWFTDSGCTYNADDIGERLRYEAENSGVLRQDAETAARNVAEQYAQWEAQNQRDLERGYSDEQKAYMDWKQEQANAEKKQELLEKLADKYHVAATEKAVKDAIKFEQTMNIIDAEVYADLGKQWDEGIETLKKVDKGCETIVNVMSGCVPGGGAVKNAYTFAKASLVATSEAIAEGKDLKEGAAHVWVGMVNGALGVIQNEAGNLTKGAKYAMVKELGINVVTEEAKEFINGIAKGQSLEEISKNMINATGKTTVSFGIGKLISGGIDKLKDTAKASLDPNDVDVDKFYFSEGTAKKIDKWLNKFEWSKTTNLKGTNIADANGVFGISKTANVVFGGQIEGDGLVGGLIGEVVNWSEDKKITNLTGWGGDVAEWANDKAVAGAANVMYGASKVAEAMPTDVIEAANSNDYSDIKDFVDNVTKFSNVAAAYRRYE